MTGVRNKGQELYQVQVDVHINNWIFEQSNRSQTSTKNTIT